MPRWFECQFALSAFICVHLRLWISICDSLLKVAVDFHVIPMPRVVEGADADLAPGEGFVGRGHDWRFHIVPVNLDRAGCDGADDLDVVPLVVPWRALGCLRRNLDAVGAVDD